jgi:hypothetical protein
MAHAALLLEGHEPLALRDCAWVGVVLKGLVGYRLDRAHVNPNHAVDVIRVLVLLVKSSKRSFFVFLSLLEQLETNKLDDHNRQEHKD